MGAVACVVVVVAAAAVLVEHVGVAEEGVVFAVAADKAVAADDVAEVAEVEEGT